jgi:fatty-acyl-CoA synthase
MYNILSVLFSGQTMILNTLRSFDAVKIWDIVARERPTVLAFSGDAMALPLIEAYDANPGRWDLSSLMVLSWGGGALSDRLQDMISERFPDAMKINGLGSTESGILTTGAPALGGEGVMRLTPRPNVAVIVDGNRYAQPGETGIVARHGHLPNGYWGNPAKTAETFVEHDGKRWVLTGDLARLDHDGLMTFYGRDALCIITGGEKVFTEEVENAVRSHPAVKDAVVIGMPHERWGETVVAVVAVEPGTELTLEEVQARCSHLARYKRPRRLVLVEHVQRSPAGKADYRWAKDAVAQAG